MQHPEEMDPLARVLYEVDRLADGDEKRHLSIQIDADIRNAIAAAENTGKAASVTIKLTFSPKGEMLEVTGSSVAKLPKAPAPTVMLYADGGELFNHNPKRARGPLPGVDVETTPKRRPQSSYSTIPAPKRERPANATPSKE